MTLRITRRELLRGGAAAAALATTSTWTTALFARSATESALDELARALHGRLLRPGEPGYAEAAKVANGRYRDILPLAVAACADEADVVTSVGWCVKHGVKPVARGGGHSYAGFSATTGLMVDLRALSSVSIDQETGVARIGGAALNRDVFGASKDGRFILPGGTCLDVGVGGLVLGGGIGYNTHWAGLTSDHLIASRIVSAAGEALEIDGKNEHQRLFWACRGGAGGSFGINTEFTFQLVEVPLEKVAFYRFDWRGADAAKAVLTAFDELLTTAPDGLNAVAMAEATPLESLLPPHEAIHTMSRGHYMGSLNDLRDIVEPLRLAAGPIRQQLETWEFWKMQAHWASEVMEPHSFGDLSRYATKALPEEAMHACIDHLVRCPHRREDANGSLWSLGWVGGSVVDRFGPTETAYVHRGVTNLHRPTIVWPDGEDAVGADLQEWAKGMFDLIAPHTPNRSYQNFPNRSLPDHLKAYYGENLKGLVDVKRAYDEGDLFRNAQSVPPSLAS